MNRDKAEKFQRNVFRAIQEAQVVAHTPTIYNVHQGPHNATNAIRVVADRHSMEVHSYTRNGNTYTYIFCRGCSTDESMVPFPCETFTDIAVEFKLEPPEQVGQNGV